MGLLVVTGGMLTCTMGMTPSPFTALATTTASEMPAGVITDMVPLENISTFGMCMSPANPEVASATAAAMGVLTPMPCIPATTSPWTPGSLKVTIGEIPALDSDSTCMCMWAGTITVSDPGQVSVTV